MLIGPQSSGKSTIAKVISFCLWLEKDVLMRRNTDYVSWSFVEKQLLEFHKLKNYLNEGYAIFFVGDAIDFCYTKDMCFAKLKDGFERCKIGKVAYIPAERNAVTLPNIASLKMPEYNTRSFIFDWLEVHQKFQKKNAVDLLKLKLKYYYDESSQKDMIVLEDGKEIGLEEASTGFAFGGIVSPLVSLGDMMTSTGILFLAGSACAYACTRYVLSQSVQPSGVLYH